MTLTLRKYQQEAVNKLTKLNRAALFDEQRTGKTPTALAIAKAKGIDKLLIVTTCSSLYNWNKEITNWLGICSVVCDGTLKRKKQIIKDWNNGALIVTLDSLKFTESREGLVGFLLSAKPEMVILDEAHKIRNVKSMAAKSMYKFNKVLHLLALTGTPEYSKAGDVFSILHWLFPKEYNSVWKFQQEYLEHTEETIYVAGRIRTITHYGNYIPEKLKELQEFLNTFATRRTRKEVMAWLPDKDYCKVELNANKIQKQALEALKETFQYNDIVTQGILDRTVKYRQICLDPRIVGIDGNSPKTEYIKNYINDYPERPIIIFSGLTEYLNILYADLAPKHKIAMITGDVNKAQREVYINDFQAAKFNVMLINTQAGKEAITLDRAEAVIFADRYPPIGDIQQAEDRFVTTTKDRKEKPHTIYNLVISDTFDEELNELIDNRATETDVINNFKKYLRR